MNAEVKGLWALKSHTIWLLLVALSPALHGLDRARPVREYRVAEWGMTDGLPYPSVAALAQSSDKYLWVATRTGLARFDGVTFTTFTAANQPALADDRITALFAASDGTLWIGTARGVTWYRNGSWSRALLGHDVDNGGIMAVCEAPDGSILIAHSVDRATESRKPSGVFRYSGGQCTELLLPDGRAMPRIDQIRRTPNGDMILVGDGVYRFRDEKLVELPKEVRIGTAQVLALATDRTGGVWMGSQLGMVHWTDDARRTFSTEQGMPSNSVRSLFFDSDENLWVGTSNGLARLADGRFQPLLIHGIEPLSNVLSITEDHERNLWVGTDNGLFRVEDVKVATLGQRDGLPVNPILCVLQARDGTQWAGTIGGGLAHITPEGIHSMHIDDGLREDSVGALAEDAQGGIWIAYYTRGLSHYFNGELRHYSPGRAVRFRGLGVDSKGTVWAASSDGLFRLNNGDFERVAVHPDIEFPRALHIDRGDGLWLAGARAFGVLRDGQWTIHHKPQALERMPYQYIFTGSANDAWVLQDGPSVIRVRNGRQEQFRFPSLGPLVYSGVEHKGELWINFRAGVARIPLAEFDAVAAGRKSRPDYTLYSETDGMRSRAPNNAGSPGSTVVNGGALWFPTSMGVAIINPPQIRLNQTPPHVVIERVVADRKEYPGNQLSRIPPGRGELAIHFTALSFANPAHVRFKYRLHGFDSGWVDAGTSRVAHYGGLSPKEYRFEVTACNNEGVWNPVGTSCVFILRPHFYQRWWFFGIVILLATGFGVGVYLWRSRQLKRRAERLQRQNVDLEQRIAERTAELRKSYDALRASEYFYHSLVESLPQVILRKDATGRYTYANAAAGELHGRPAAEFIGRTDEELFSPDAARKEQEADARVLELRTPMEHEEIVERNGEPKRYLHVKRVPLHDGAGKALGVLVLFWDTTVFRETEDKLRHAQRELVEISRLAGIADMATGILHNLGNALNSVKVAASVAREKVGNSDTTGLRRIAEMLTTEKQREGPGRDAHGTKLAQYLTLLGDKLETERSEILRELQQLVAGIEHVAQIIAAQQDGARVGGIIETVAPKELADYACQMSQALLERNRVVVSREFMPVPEITVERQKVLQILGNLVRNAIDAVVESNRPDKRITISVRPGGENTVEIAVADNGVGILPQNLRRIFEFGFTTKRGGHGFGLHNSAVAAQEMGGTLRVASGPEQGATFVLELPVVAQRKNSLQVDSELPLRVV